jgi:YD repeat-containing protein
MVDAVGTNHYTFTTGGQLQTEGGLFGSDIVTSTYVNRMRMALSLQQPTGAWTNGFAYDGAKRLTSLTSQAGTFNYAYLSGLPSALVAGIGLPNTSYITNFYDEDGRLTATYLKNSGNTILGDALYGYNEANQRTSYTNAAGTYYLYSYDPIGQLRVATSSTSSENRGYLYDAAWNLHPVRYGGGG